MLKITKKLSSINENKQQATTSQFQSDDAPDMGGGLPVIKYSAEHTLSTEGLKLWKTLLHKSACLSCAWGTGGQRGFTKEEGEKLQRCMKSVKTIFAKI